MEPFPHFVVKHDRSPSTQDMMRELDGAFDIATWKNYENGKQATSAVEHLHWFKHMASRETIIELSEMFNVPLQIDPTYRGAGLHRVAAGGKLGIHVDFNRHPTLPLKRAVNVIMYLNDPWPDEWGGHLELWDEEKCRVKIAPTRGTLVAFEYSSRAWHGHPEPLRCPEGVWRRSVAMYYYTTLTGDEKFHSTIYR